MTLSSSIYVITNFEMNHNSLNSDAMRRLPIDSRLLEQKNKYIFYITDNKQLPTNPCKNVIIERELDLQLHKVGKKHLAEWSFLLAERKHAFCSYPFFMISSRFYTKNKWLTTSLNQEWEKIFSYFQYYSHGFLPSYSRPVRWVKFAHLINNSRLISFSANFFQLVTDLYQVKIPQEYSIFPDLGCHYLGFKDRNALLNYVNFYDPLMDFFFSYDFTLKKNPLDYVQKTGCYPNEKPLTFLFEVLSHLFFFKRKTTFFCLHYDGYYEFNFASKKITQLHSVKISPFTKIKRTLQWRWNWLKTEGVCFYPRLFRFLYKLKYLFFSK